MKNKKQSEAPSGYVDWERRKGIWLNKLTGLMDDIAAWLDPYQADGLLDYTIKTMEIQEEKLGVYHSQSMHIQVSAEKVTLMPVATIILGGFGRVDMTAR